MRSSNIINGRINYSDLVRVTTTIKENEFLNTNDILLCARNGSKRLVGKCALINDAKEPLSFGAFMAVYRSNFNKYIIHFLNTETFRHTFITDDSKQINQLTQEIIKRTLLPLPPINEQERIAIKVNSLLTIIDDIEHQNEDIACCIENTKAKILDLAIKGKLVPQNPDDEPASVLLERIRAEKEELIKQGKIKRDKNESVIFKGEDNSYYDEIPHNWMETSILAIAEVELGKALDSKNNTENLYPYLRSVNIKWNGVDLSDLKQMRFNPEEVTRYTVKKGDLLICEGGDVGRCCIWDKEDNIFYQNALHRVRFYGDINPKFFLYYLMYLESIGYLKRISNGVTIKHLTKSVLSTIPFLLPPLKEQDRIVDAVSNAFKIVDSI